MSEEKSRKKRWLVWGMAVSIVVLLFAPVMIFRAVNRAAFERKVAELKAAGQPVSMDDLEAAYVLPEGVENAADVYQKAFRAYVEPNEAAVQFLPVCGTLVRTEDMPPFPPEVMEAVRVRLEENAECLELLDRAGRMEHCLLPRRRMPGFFFVNDSVPPLRRTSQLMMERNLYLAQTGQVDALYESSLTMFMLTAVLSKQPTVIDHLTTLAVQAMAASGLKDSLNMVQFTDAQLAEFQNRLRGMQPIQTYANATVNDRAGLVDLLSGTRADLSSYLSVSGWLSMFTMGVLVHSGMKDKDAVILLECQGRQLQILQLPLHEQAAEINKLSAEISDYSVIHYLLELMAPSFRVHSISLRVEGGIRCAETAVAVERYRLKYGKLPGLLTELVPEFLAEVYLDPFDGNPLRYVLRPEGGYMIYCIGEDGVDNGGVDMSHKVTGAGGAPEYDWPFTVRR
jgi:hypothetical protein